MDQQQYFRAASTDDGKRALPLETYSSAEVFEVECRHVFGGDWVFVGTSAGLDEPGDVKPVRVGAQPVLLWRGKDGELRAMANLCAHRGMLLAEEPGNHARIVCPYHAWAYDDTGKLLGAPFGKEIDRQTHCLRNYRTAVWRGLVFVSLRDDVAEFAERMAAIDRAVEGFVPPEVTPWRSLETEETWDANWKLIYSNAVESYHLFQVHPETLEPYTPTKSSRTVESTEHAIVTAGVLREGAGKEPKGEYRLIGLPPNLVCVLDGSGLYWQSVEPEGPSRSIVRTGAVVPGKEPKTAAGKFMAKTLSQAWSGMSGDFLPEDKDICERAQRAASGSYEPGSLVALEEPIAHFHRFLGRCL